MNRDRFYAEILPIADAMLQSQVEVRWDHDADVGDDEPSRERTRGDRCFWGTDGYSNLCIIGPDADEIAALMPMTASAVSRGGGWWSEPALDEDGKIVSGANPTVFPIDEDTDLGALLDDFWYWRWCDDWCSAVVLLVPPFDGKFAEQFHWPDFDHLNREIIELRKAEFGLLAKNFDSNKAITAAWEPFLRVVNPNTSFALAMACALWQRHETWIALPDEQLSHRASAKLRKWAATEQNRRYQAVNEALRTSPQAITIGGDEEAETWAEVRLACWINGPSPFVPDRAWAIDAQCTHDENPYAITLAGSSCLGHHQSFHYRRKLSGPYREAATSTEAWKQLLSIPTGGMRTEDDRFVLVDDIYGPNSGDYWSVCGEDPTDQPMWAHAVKLGYPPRTVADVCRGLTHRRELTEKEFSPGQIVIPLRGHQAGWALDRWPSPPFFADVDETDDHADTGRPEKRESYVIPEAIVLRCDDPDFLRRQLWDSHDYLVSRSMGSLDQPIVPRHLVENLKVLWPPAHERAAISQAIAAAILFSQGDSDTLVKEIERLRRKVSMLFGTAYNHEVVEDEPASPFYYVQQWAAVQRSVETIGQQLRSVAGAVWRDAVRRPPITIGNLLRRKRLAEERAERIKLQFELAELLLRHHAFVGLALLREIDPDQLAAFLHGWFQGRETWNGSMGHWKEAGSRIAALLRQRTDAYGSEYIRPIADDHLSVDTGKLEAIAGPIINLRNKQLAHGHAPTGPTATKLEETLDEHTDALSSLLDYLSNRALLQVNGRWREATGTRLNVRYLTGDHELVESTKFDVDEATATATYDGLVHVQTGRGWHMLPLHPWLTYQAEEKHGAEALWLFDGFDEKTVHYCSPLRPGVTLKAGDLRQALAGLMSR